MSTTPQPTIAPFASAQTEIEAAYIEEQPPGLWPTNSDSNFGVHRKLFTDILTDVANQLDLLLQEKFIQTSVEFLALHEEELGLPQNPSGKTIQQRQSIALSALKRGPFTRSLRRQIIEAFISATFGPALRIGTGIPIGSGLQMFSGLSSLAGAYSIVEDIENFSYQVQLLQSVAVDIVGLIRELTRVTPAGISFTIVSVPAPAGGGGYGTDVYGTGAYGSS